MRLSWYIILHQFKVYYPISAWAPTFYTHLRKLKVPLSTLLRNIRKSSRSISNFLFSYHVFLVCPPRPIQLQENCWLTEIAKWMRMVKQQCFVKGKLRCYDYCTFLKLKNCHFVTNVILNNFILRYVKIILYKVNSYIYIYMNLP